jgi:hypothetical protein
MRFDTQFDGARTSSVVLPPIELPPQPFIQNFSNVWKIAPGADFTIRWSAWPNVNTNTDKIVFSVERLTGAAVFSSDDSNTRHPLLPVSTNVIIFGEHGNTSSELAANQSYIARLRFERRLKSESPTYPGARGTGAVFSETAFYISTFDASKLYKAAATFDRTNVLVQIKVGTSPQIGRSYAVYETRDLRTWNYVATENVTTTNIILFTTPPSEPAVYYKAVLLP